MSNVKDAPIALTPTAVAGLLGLIAPPRPALRLVERECSYPAYSAKEGSAKLLAAILRHHPERCGTDHAR
ncbi:MAG: hypothetical protein U5M50_08725 [Sphingobium sp.]|nr:hypothetical protein [Sphingobium sp.]